MEFRGRLGVRSPSSLAVVWALCCCLCRVAGVAGTMAVLAAASVAGGNSALGDSGSVMLFPTDPGAQDGASEGATVAPAVEHEDDNSPGYTAERVRMSRWVPIDQAISLAHPRGDKTPFRIYKGTCWGPERLF
ncbi:hypothetical protein AALO_G00202680 [Alosa alosa]|uniref:Melanin-concentrating hormone n=1 Tax=Alosa alosa TaxID=278164 RepID=A0AAV6G2Z4_9TELE|nr:hypothetical protein AALO_G00202680 [Alosa alosa]